jgi:hypothetical protein
MSNKSVSYIVLRESIINLDNMADTKVTRFEVGLYSILLQIDTSDEEIVREHGVLPYTYNSCSPNASNCLTYQQVIDNTYEWVKSIISKLDKGNRVD